MCIEYSELNEEFLPSQLATPIPWLPKFLVEVTGARVSVQVGTQVSSIVAAHPNGPEVKESQCQNLEGQATASSIHPNISYNHQQGRFI